MDSNPTIRDLSAAIAGMEGVLSSTTELPVRTLLENSLRDLRTRLADLTTSTAAGGGTAVNAEAMDVDTNITVDDLEQNVRRRHMNNIRANSKIRLKITKRPEPPTSATKPQKEPRTKKRSYDSSSEGDDDDDDDDEEEEDNHECGDKEGGALTLTKGNRRLDEKFAAKEASNTLGDGYRTGGKCGVVPDDHPLKKYRGEVRLCEAVICNGPRKRTKNNLYNYGWTPTTQYENQLVSGPEITEQQKIVRALKVRARQTESTMKHTKAARDDSLVAQRQRIERGSKNEIRDNACAKRVAAYNAAYKAHQRVLRELAKAESVEDKALELLVEEQKACDMELEVKKAEPHFIGKCGSCGQHCVCFECQDDACAASVCVECLLKRIVPWDCRFPNHKYGTNKYVQIVKTMAIHVVKNLTGATTQTVNERFAEYGFDPINRTHTPLQLLREAVAQALWRFLVSPSPKDPSMSMYDYIFGDVLCLCPTCAQDRDVVVFVGDERVDYDPTEKVFLVEGCVVDPESDSDSDSSDGGSEYGDRNAELDEIGYDSDVPMLELKAAVAEAKLAELDSCDTSLVASQGGHLAVTRDIENDAEFSDFLLLANKKLRQIVRDVRAVGGEQRHLLREQLAELEASLGGNAPKPTPAPKPTKAATPALPPVEKEKEKEKKKRSASELPADASMTSDKKKARKGAVALDATSQKGLKKRSASELPADAPTTSDKKARKGAMGPRDVAEMKPKKFTAEENKELFEQLAALEAEFAPKKVKK